MLRRINVESASLTVCRTELEYPLYLFADLMHLTALNFAELISNPLRGTNVIRADGRPAGAGGPDVRINATFNHGHFLQASSSSCTLTT